MSRAAMTVHELKLCTLVRSIHLGTFPGEVPVYL